MAEQVRKHEESGMSEDTIIIDAARDAHRRYWRATSDVGIGDRQASEVTRAWQQQILASYGNRFQAKVPVSVGLHEKIDLVDLKSGVAYELKVSGNNPHHEFYKDIFKVVVYNQSHDAKIRRLVFITAESGAARLQKGLGRAGIKVAPQIGFNITVEGI